MNEKNKRITRRKRKRTENEKKNESNEKRQRYEIYVNLNDPGSVPKG